MKKYNLTFFVLAILLILSGALALTFGPAKISITDITQCVIGKCVSPIHQMIIWEVRIPRILVGVVAGMGLAIAGAILQNTTRNPLADPYIFGIVSGAALGATIATITLSNQLTVALPLAAFIGALFSVLIVVFISTALKNHEQLLLTGIAVSFMLTAISQFLLYLGEPFATNRVLFWLMGSLARVEMSNFYIIGSILLISLLVIIAYHRQIDALLLGDESASSLGVNVNKLRLLMLAICAAITATVVAYCGGIGFVGLMIPHIVRQFIGVTTLPLIIGSALVGGSFLVWVDVGARSALESAELPLGIITSAIGSIFFIGIMLKVKNKITT